MGARIDNQWPALLRVRRQVEDAAQEAWRQCCRERDAVAQQAADVERRRRDVAAEGTHALAALGRALQPGRAVDRAGQGVAAPYLARLRRLDQQLYLEWLQLQLRLAVLQARVEAAQRQRRAAEAARLRIEEVIAMLRRQARRHAARRDESGIDDFVLARRT